MTQPPPPPPPPSGAWPGSTPEPSEPVPSDAPAFPSYPPSASPGGTYPPPASAFPPPPAVPGPSTSYGAPPTNLAGSGPVVVPGVGKVATVMQRLLARVVDSVIFSVAWFLLLAGGLVSFSASVDPETGEISGGGFFAFFIGLFLLSIFGIVYEVVFIALKGQTIGKMVMGVKVVSQSNGGPIGWGPSLVRYLIPAVASLLTCGLGGIAVLLTPLMDSSGRLQGWHDKAASDLVISTR